MRSNPVLYLVVCLASICAAAPAAFASGPRLITVHVEWRLDPSAAPSWGATGAPPAGSVVGVMKPSAAGARSALAADAAALSVTVAEDALGSATYHSASFGDLLVTVRPHVNADGTVFANILVRRIFESAKTEVSTGHNFHGDALVLLGRMSLTPPFASPGQIYAKAFLASDFKDPFAPVANLGSGEAK